MSHCIQCGESLDTYVDDFYYCINVECPNYGLYQKGIENMPLAKTNSDLDTREQLKKKL